MANFKSAWKAFWSILKDDDKAKAWEQLATPAEAPKPELPIHKEEITKADTSNALHLLAILQREARFIDYIQEGLDGYDDATVGSVSRKIHDDCQRTLDSYFHIVPVMSEAEQTQVQVPADFDPRSIKITGNAGTPPYTGVLQHKGWKASKQEMPTRNNAQDPMVICPAEVEI